MNAIRTTWQNSLTGKLLIGCSALVLMACICAVPLTLFGVLAPADEAVAPTSPAPAPAPTFTPAVASPPTATLAPMPTAAPTATQGLPPEAESYINTVVEKVGIMGTAMKELGVLLQELELGNDEWVARVAVQIVVIQTVHQNLEAMAPPSGLEEAHRVLLEGTGACSEATDYVVLALEDVSTEEMETGIGLLTMCKGKLEKASTLMLEYMEKYK